MHKRRHCWIFEQLSRGPRGAIRFHSRCNRCGLEATNQSWSRLPVPSCTGAPIVDARADAWLLQFVAMNTMHRPERPYWDQEERRAA